MSVDTTNTATEPAPPPAATLYTEQQVADALNHAADEILDAVDAGDDGLRDGLNLLVNATIAYLTGRHRPCTTSWNTAMTPTTRRS
jgi:hypothetical protein